MPDPVIHPHAATYLEAANERRLVVPHCRDCETSFFPPRVACPYCLSDELGFTSVEGDGTLYSYSVVRTESHPDRGGEAPYPVALVELDDGPVLFSTVVDCPLTDLSVGMELTVTFEELTEGQLYPVFAPVE